MKEMQIVKIEWVDSISNGGWEIERSAKDIHPGHVTSVGYLFDCSDDYVTIVQNYIGEEGMEQACNVMSIPRCAVKSIVYLDNTNVYNDPSKAVNPNR